MNRNEYPLAIGALLAYLRYPLLAIALLLLLAGCVGCGALAYSFGAQGEYSLNYRTFSAGILVDGCNSQIGFYDSRTHWNNSIEFRICK